MENTSRIYVALDGMVRSNAFELARALAPEVRGFKGNDLFDREPEEAFIFLKTELGSHVFADPKLHDIPNTVANRMRNFVEMGADLVTVHASGGKAMMEAAVKATEGSPTKVLAVTVLTSLEPVDCLEIYGMPSIGKVKQLAELAAEAGVWGIVCSPEETAIIKRSELPLIVINPGIRPAGASADDQARKATPSGAIAVGADWLVIGRPITAAANPVDAARRINEEVTQALHRQTSC